MIFGNLEDHQMEIGHGNKLKVRMELEPNVDIKIH